MEDDDKGFYDIMDEISDFHMKPLKTVHCKIIFPQERTSFRNSKHRRYVYYRSSGAKNEGNAMPRKLRTTSDTVEKSP